MIRFALTFKFVSRIIVNFMLKSLIMSDGTMFTMVI